MSISAVIKYEDNRVSIHTSKAKSVSTTLEKGFYTSLPDGKGGLTIKEEFLPELHTPYNTEENETVIETVKSFFKKGIKERVNALGVIHKLGILSFGKQGTGKTARMNYIASKMIDECGAIAFLCGTGEALQGAISLAKAIREIQDTPIIFIADEFEKFAGDYESAMKSLLDGVDSIENTLFLGATNYIDLIPDSLKDRPSRFKIVQELKGMEDKKQIEGILLDLCSKVTPPLMTLEEIQEEIKGQDNYTLDELKHIVLSRVTDSYVKVKKTTTTPIGFGAKKEISEEEDKKLMNRAIQKIHNDWWADAPSPQLLDINSNI